MYRMATMVGNTPGERAGEPDRARGGLGAALRRAWVGYRRRLDAELAAAGFGDHRFPDGRVLRFCARTGETTIARIGRELGISPQGAGKVVAGLRDDGYVTLTASAASGREKVVRLTPRATDYLAAHRRAARRIERDLRAETGAESIDALYRLLHALGDAEQPRLRDYLGISRDVDDVAEPDD